MIKYLNLQLFADAGTLVNATNAYVNAYTGETTAFSGKDDLTAGNKTYYDTVLLENSRDKLIFVQLGKKQVLPANHGTSMEWRKWNKTPRFRALNEAVIPPGEKLGQTVVSAPIAQYGQYVTISDRIDLHYIDDAVQGAVEEVGASGGLTHDELCRNKLVAECSNVLFADALDADGKVVSTPTTEAELQTALATKNVPLSYNAVDKGATNLKVGGAPTFDMNSYVAVVHPHVAYDLRRDPMWKDVHTYSAPEEIFNGEIGALAGVRFIESNLAPIIKKDGQTYATYKVLIFGKDAFGVIDPEGGGMQTILKDKSVIGGPLEQFSTVGAKFETATKILYPERLVAIWCGSSFSGEDETNIININ